MSIGNYLLLAREKRSDVGAGISLPIRPSSTPTPGPVEFRRCLLKAGRQFALVGAGESPGSQYTAYECINCLCLPPLWCLFLSLYIIASNEIWNSRLRIE